MAVFKYLKGEVDKNKQEKNSNNNKKTTGQTLPKVLREWRRVNNWNLKQRQVFESSE